MFELAHIARDFGRARHYEQHAIMQYDIGEQLIARAAPYLAKDTLLLDVGCGSGNISAQWPMRTVGVDAALGMCLQARQHIPALQADAAQLPFAHDTFDAVASNVMLQWLAQPQDFFTEAQRVLKPGGLLAVTTFGEMTLGELKQAFADAGMHRRISDFLTPALPEGFELLESDRQLRRESYDDVMQLYGYLRAIGATNKRADRPRGLLTPRRLQQAQQHYARVQGQVHASWEVITLIARKR